MKAKSCGAEMGMASESGTQQQRHQGVALLPLLPHPYPPLGSHPPPPSSPHPLPSPSPSPWSASAFCSSSPAGCCCPSPSCLCSCASSSCLCLFPYPYPCPCLDHACCVKTSAAGFGFGCGYGPVCAMTWVWGVVGVPKCAQVFLDSTLASARKARAKICTGIASTFTLTSSKACTRVCASIPRQQQTSKAGLA